MTQPSLRSRIVKFLIANPGQTAAQIRQGLSEPRSRLSSISSALHGLKASGLVRTVVDAHGPRGGFVYRAATPDPTPAADSAPAAEPATTTQPGSTEPA